MKKDINKEKKRKARSKTEVNQQLLVVKREVRRVEEDDTSNQLPSVTS